MSGWSSLSLRGAANIGKLAGKHGRHLANTAYKLFRIQPQIVGELEPSMRANVAQTVHATDLHCETGAL